MSLPRRLKAVVFDMDGLLFDTEPLYQLSFVEAAEEFGVVMDPADLLSLIGKPWVRNRAALLDWHGTGFPVDDYATRVQHCFEVRALSGVPIKPGGLELLDSLDRFGIKRAIATSSGHPSASRHLAQHGLTARFDTVVAAGDYKAGKPAPDPYLVAASRLEVEPEFCVALEDSHAGVRSASSAGTMTIMVPDLLPATDEIRALCVLVAETLHQVNALVVATLEAPP